MTEILVHRLELAGPIDLNLDADLLHWFALCVTGGQTQRWLDHTHGLVGN